MSKHYKNEKKNYFGCLRSKNNLNKENIKYIDTEAPIEELFLPQRIENALKLINIKSLGDLIQLEPKKLYKTKNIGIKSIKILDGLLDSYIREKKYNNYLKELNKIKDNYNNFKLQNLAGLIDTMLSKLKNERAVNIIKLRFGLEDGKIYTLEEIGQKEGVTRERIRQIQKKELVRFKKINNKDLTIINFLLTNWLLSRYGVVDEQEVDDYFLKLGIKNYKGAAIMLLSENLKIIRSIRKKGIKIYYPISEFDINKIISKVEEVLTKTHKALTLETIRKEIGIKKEYVVLNKNYSCILSEHILKKLFKLVPTINEISVEGDKLYTLHTNRFFFPQYWSDVIYKTVKNYNKPLHFTEIAEKVNDLNVFNKQIDVRRVHAILIDDKRFAHTGVRGAYGLTEWGIRKEMLPDLIKECMNKAGFPLYLDQILHYVSKYKYTKRANVHACLYGNKQFYRLNNGSYWLTKKKKKF
jgi:hypothetical protein